MKVLFRLHCFFLGEFGVTVNWERNVQVEICKSVECGILLVRELKESSRKVYERIARVRSECFS